MIDVIQYIIQFLVRGNDDISRYIGYTSDTEVFNQYKIVIIPSGFFDKGMYGTTECRVKSQTMLLRHCGLDPQSAEKKEILKQVQDDVVLSHDTMSMPHLPLNHIENIPLLFGTPEIERFNDTLVVHADIIASSFFLLSRYEEIVRRNVRDEHGRFPGKESLPYRAGFINRPIVDLYGKLLCKWLANTGITLETEKQPFLSKIYLTHDVDEPFYCRTWSNVFRIVSKGTPLREAIRLKMGRFETDPYNTFPWILNEDKRFCDKHPDTQVIFFFKTGGKAKQDRPHYSLNDKDIRSLMQLISRYDARIGLHSSYESSGSSRQLAVETERFRQIDNPQKSPFHRSHFLASREPEHMNRIEQAGFTDDFTVGYADVVGFRLGTAHAVRYINPVEMRLSPTLHLHPLVIMDSTLSSGKYMGLSENEAFTHCRSIIEEIKQVNGELVVLWHNSSFAEGVGYHRSLYHQLLNLNFMGGFKTPLH